VRHAPIRLLAALSIAAPLLAQAHPQTRAGAASPSPLAPFASRLGMLPADQLAALSSPPSERVIVLLRDQPAALSGLAQARSAFLRVSRAPLLAELAQVRATGVVANGLIDAVSATVSPAEAVRLAADPAVRAVVPDRVIRLGHRAVVQPLAAPDPVAGGGGGKGKGKGKQPVAQTPPPQPLPACTSGKRPELAPEGLELTGTASDNPAIPVAQRLRTPGGTPITGVGVKVAYIAEGIDPNNPDLIRPNGQHVIVDYQDFSGDGPDAPTGGGEAFLDASTIGAQGRKSYDVNSFLAVPLPKPCRIRILGAAPGAQIVALKVFGQFYQTTTSAFLQAIDYAVNVAHVDVLNESFGGNATPDRGGDPIALADNAAVAAGVTVVVSSGDAGMNSTIGSPATDPEVISAGASTQNRLLSQADVRGVGYVVGNGHFISNNIASLSSSGFSQTGPRTIDVVAPGYLSWNLCTPTTTTPPAFADCTNLLGKPSAIGLAGGTSESAPFIASEAALIIQGYRSTHHGSSPTPALVKELITSTATDLGVPADQQGAGLIDSYRAVQAALSYRDEHGSPSRRGDTLLAGPDTAFSAEARPDSAESFSFDVTNNGTTRQLVAPQVRSMRRLLSSQSYSRYLDPLSLPSVYLDAEGLPESFVQQDIPVVPGTQQLDASIAWLATTQPSSAVSMSLFDPSGAFVNNTDPQGPRPGSGYGKATVRNPAPGVWHAILITFGFASRLSYHGLVRLDVAERRFAPAGSISPAARVLAPGQHATFTASVRTPTQPGNASDVVVFPSPSGKSTQIGAIPISLRSLVPLGSGGGSFSGTIRGGNGCSGSPGQQLSYGFDVPAGLRDMDISLRVADPSNNLVGTLVDPEGQPVDVQTTVAAIDLPTNTPTFYTGAMQFFRRNPLPGRYQFVLSVNATVSGASTAQPFEARIAYNQAFVRSRGVPDSAKTVLPLGQAASATVLVGNSGIVSKNIFLDARLATKGSVALMAPSSYSVTLPLTSTQQLPNFVVPPEVSQLEVAAFAPTPFSLELYPSTSTPPNVGTFSPDLVESSGRSADPTSGQYRATISVQASEVAVGPWGTGVALRGPYPPNGGANPSKVDVSATATGQPFDPAVDSSTGDHWSPLSPIDRPRTVPPGSEVAIRVLITPRGTPGTVVKGFLYVDAYNANTGSADELSAIPYSYTIGN